MLLITKIEKTHELKFSCIRALNKDISSNMYIRESKLYIPKLKLKLLNNLQFDICFSSVQDGK